MNNLTFNDIAMPVSFYDETGVWGYMVNPDHKDFKNPRNQGVSRFQSGEELVNSVGK